MKLTTKIRLLAGLNKYDRAPVVILHDSDQEPIQEGFSWSYLTRGGRPIYHPSAYAKKGWSNMFYRASNRIVAVGDRYILSHF